jgi:hypothetical protein
MRHFDQILLVTETTMRSLYKGGKNKHKYQFFQVCSELDVGLSKVDWLRLRRLLLGGPDGGDASAADPENLVILGDFLSELQALRRGQRRENTTSRARNTPEVKIHYTYNR